MADKTKIEWADATANYVNGCSVVSPGCTHCYAMKQAHRFPVRAGLTRQSKGGMVWTGEIRTNDKVLDTVLGWKKPRAIFWNAHGDLFHESVPDDVIDRQFAVMALTPQHRHMVLTKRPERMREYCCHRANLRRVAHLLNEMKPSPLYNGNVYQGWQEIHGKGFLPNVWLGTSVEDQKRADERIPHLLATPAAVRFLSCEPLLGPVDLSLGRLHGPLSHYCSRHFPRKDCGCDRQLPGLDWIIVGGESGSGARPMQPDWARSLRDQCADAGVPFHFKQWGEWFPLDEAEREFDLPRQPCRDLFLCQTTEDHAKIGKKKAGRLLDGVQHDGAPNA
ncbi:phage Gp37/Gp68 family protein [Allopontixanthobacter sp.]|uniref:phage Gp37/Gp68 family protein n=1 Tax=Allopontixanthobacter sp. TaxID=2906452 RepID=UPI002AB8DA44|nr:phage Gp37/Gp68 family protein [Allopontixanthobacter sp.]MDZ4308406.1 phage Gp37/Gp68 family protein [Allopontixanthobacter sp.]